MNSDTSAREILFRNFNWKWVERREKINTSGKSLVCLFFAESLFPFLSSFSVADCLISDSISVGSLYFHSILQQKETVRK